MNGSLEFPDIDKLLSALAIAEAKAKAADTQIQNIGNSMRKATSETGKFASKIEQMTKAGEGLERQFTAVANIQEQFKVLTDIAQEIEKINNYKVPLYSDQTDLAYLRQRAEDAARNYAEFYEEAYQKYGPTALKDVQDITDLLEKSGIDKSIGQVFHTSQEAIDGVLQKYRELANAEQELRQLSQNTGFIDESTLEDASKQVETLKFNYDELLQRVANNFPEAIRYIESHRREIEEQFASMSSGDYGTAALQEVVSAHEEAAAKIVEAEQAAVDGVVEAEHRKSDAIRQATDAVQESAAQQATAGVINPEAIRAEADAVEDAANREKEAVLGAAEVVLHSQTTLEESSVSIALALEKFQDICDLIDSYGKMSTDDPARAPLAQQIIELSNALTTVNADFLEPVKVALGEVGLSLIPVKTATDEVKGSMQELAEVVAETGNGSGSFKAMAEAQEEAAIRTAQAVNAEAETVSEVNNELVKTETPIQAVIRNFQELGNLINTFGQMPGDTGNSLVARITELSSSLAAVSPDLLKPITEMLESVGLSSAEATKAAEASIAEMAASHKQAAEQISTSSQQIVQAVEDERDVLSTPITGAGDAITETVEKIDQTVASISESGATFSATFRNLEGVGAALKKLGFSEESISQVTSQIQDLNFEIQKIKLSGTTVDDYFKSASVAVSGLSNDTRDAISVMGQLTETLSKSEDSDPTWIKQFKFNDNAVIDFTKAAKAQAAAFAKMQSVQKQINDQTVKYETEKLANTTPETLKMHENELARLREEYDKAAASAGKLSEEQEKILSDLRQAGEEQLASKVSKITSKQDAKLVEGTKEYYNYLTQINNALNQCKQLQEGVRVGDKVADPDAITKLNQLTTELENLKNGFNDLSKVDAQTKFAALKTDLASLKGEFTSVGAGLNTFVTKLGGGVKRYLAMTFSTFRLITRAVQTVKEMVNTTIEIDTAMNQLQIVTKASDAEMQAFFKNASSLARELGTSITDVLSSMETFSRLGYNLDESSVLSRFAGIMQNVASVTQDEATTGITAIIKGYGMQVEDAERVADVLTQVGQKYAVSAGELMEAFEKSGAALNATGVSFEKSAALIAAANASIQNSSTVGKFAPMRMGTYV